MAAGPWWLLNPGASGSPCVTCGHLGYPQGWAAGASGEAAGHNPRAVGVPWRAPREGGVQFSLSQTAALIAPDSAPLISVKAWRWEYAARKCLGASLHWNIPYGAVTEWGAEFLLDREALDTPQAELWFGSLLCSLLGHTKLTFLCVTTSVAQSSLLLQPSQPILCLVAKNSFYSRCVLEIFQVRFGLGPKSVPFYKQLHQPGIKLNNVNTK